MKETIENLKSHVYNLATDIGSRSVLEELSLRRAQEYVHGQFAGMGLEVKVQEYKAYGTRTANLIVTGEGSDTPASYLLLGAHYDTVPGTPGADDNASAVAVMLETTRLLTVEQGKIPFNVLLVAFSTEEPPSFNTGHMGSRIFVRSLPGSDVTVKGAIILEMVGYFTDQPGSQQIPFPLKFMGFPDTGNFIAVVGNGRSRSLVKKVCDGVVSSGCTLPVENIVIPGSGSLLPESRLSDNASFWDAGIPAVMITDTSFFRNPHYHSHTDRPNTLDYEKMGQLVKGLSHVLRLSVTS
jgi:Zn-dependent M28 family amino/carboxypeptidase